jgi:hypothetical protein
MTQREKQMLDLMKSTIALLNDPNADEYQAGDLSYRLQEIVSSYVEPMEVDGTYSGNQLQGHMEWNCPFTSELKNCTGQFLCDGDYYYHTILDDNDQILYTIKAK